MTNPSETLLAALRKCEEEAFMGGSSTPDLSPRGLTFKDVERAVAPFLRCLFVMDSLMEEARKVLDARTANDLVRLHPIPDWIFPDGSIQALLFHEGRRDRCPVCSGTLQLLGGKEDDA
jgi:hypothetical protein